MKYLLVKVVRRLRRWFFLLSRHKPFYGLRRSRPAGFPPPGRRRYLSERIGESENYLTAARDYVERKQEGERAWLYCKPYEVSPGNSLFYTEMYQVMNLLKAMDIPFRGKVLEVGSGPGWVTEILVALGYEVHGLEPSSDMIEIARERVSSAIDHWKIKNPPPYDFVCQTLEDCTLPSEEYDAVLFHAALHHVIDEKAGLAQCFRLLKAGGVIGVSEAAWEPGNRALEAALDEEMERFGTLENPYTREYLDFLLTDAGFIDIRRYHSVNGLIPEKLGKRSVGLIAEAVAETSNNLTAVKGGDKEITTRNDLMNTSAMIRVLAIEYSSPDHSLVVELEIKNTGKSVWLHKEQRFGWVRVALRTDPLGAVDYAEANRNNLPKDVKPGEILRESYRFSVPDEFEKRNWYIDLVNEEVFWFSSRGTDPVLIEMDGLGQSHS